MARYYFVAANAWLLATFICYVGKTWERTQPTRYSLFGVGRSFSPSQYDAMTAIPFVFAAVCLWLYWRNLPSGAFRFSFQTLLIAFTFTAIIVGSVIIILRQEF